MEHLVLTAIRRAAFVPIGWFAPTVEDRVPGEARFVILIGNAGPDMFRRFARERDPARDTMDDWTREVVSNLARGLDASPVFPFDTPPLPFLTWARRAGAGHVSPLGLNIHPTYGLWHAYRAALLFPVAFDLPTQIGYDSDHALAAGEVGKVGVAIDSIDDMTTLFDGDKFAKANAPAGGRHAGDTRRSP